MESTSEGMRSVVDQMNEVGFDMMIYSFGSGYQFETHNKTYLNQIKGDIAYAKNKGIEVGGYDLICLDRGHGGYGGNVGDQWATVLKDGSYGADACFASGWYDVIHNLTLTWIKDAGLSMVETDGPYVFSFFFCLLKSIFTHSSTHTHTHTVGTEEKNVPLKITRITTVWRIVCTGRHVFRLSTIQNFEH